MDGALKLPYFAATAWYHKNASRRLIQSKDLNDMLPEVEEFTMNELLPRAKGGALEEGKKRNCSKNGSLLRYVRKGDFYKITLIYWIFLKELLRSSFTVGRLDSRYKGIDKRCW
jgi:hypothetical protein